MSVDPSDKPRNETEHERLDRQLMELLQGFRVATTGVQVLFAFLLTVPFSATFDTKVGDLGKALFYVALFGAGVASVCFIAPVIQHRILFRQGQKALLIRRANRFGIAGAFALGVSMTAATTLVVQALSDKAAASVATVMVALVMCGWSWFVQPFMTRLRVERRASETEAS